MKPTRSIPATLLALSLAACASAPPVLVALPPPPPVLGAEQRHEHSRATVLVRPVALPGYLDSHALVVGRKANTLIVSDEAEWAERLRDAVTRVLRDALAQRLGASRVLIRGEHRAPDAELVVEFLRLDPADGELQLDARWSFACKAPGRSPHAGRTQLQVPLEGVAPTAIATATAKALSEFAEVLAGPTWCQ